METMTVYAGWRVERGAQVGIVAWNQWGNDGSVIAVWTLANLQDEKETEVWPIAEVTVGSGKYRAELGSWESR